MSNRTPLYLTTCMIIGLVALTFGFPNASRGAVQPEPDVRNQTPHPRIKMGETPRSETSRPLQADSDRISDPTPGARRIYRFELDLKIDLELASKSPLAAEGSDTPILNQTSVQCSGTLEQTFLQSTSESRLHHYRVLEINLIPAEADSTLSSTLSGECADIQSRDFFVRANPEGALQEILESQPQSSRIQPLLISIFQQIHQPHRVNNSTSWTRSVPTLVGRVQVEYNRSNPDHLTRRVLTLQKLALSGNVPAGSWDLLDLSGDAQIGLDETQNLQHIRSDDEIQIRLDQRGIRVHLQTHTEISGRPTTPSLSSEMCLARCRVLDRCQKIFSADETDSLWDDSTSATAPTRRIDRSIHDILENLTGTDPSMQRGSRARVNALRDLALALSQNPGARSQARYLLHEGNSEIRKLLVTSLGAAGTPECQSLLMDVLLDPQQKQPLRIVGLQSLIQTQTPTDETVDTLLQISEDPTDPVTDTACLMLGSTLGKMPESGDREFWVESLQRLGRNRAHEASGRIVFLQALGNGGLDETLPDILPHLNDEDEEVQFQAVRALRNIHSSRATTLLRKIAKSNSSKILREEAQHILLNNSRS